MKKTAIVLFGLMSTIAVAQDRVSKFDRNGDQGVDRSELTSVCEVSKGLFDRADKDSDGKLTNSELRTARGYLFSRCDEAKLVKYAADTTAEKI